MTAAVVPLKSRREEYAEATRAGLLDSATEHFVSKGYADASLEEVARAARVTKGALYHHFPGGKAVLFEAVFQHVDERLADHVGRAIPADATPWELAEKGLDAYLDICSDPTVRRIIFQEGPVALGWERWRDMDGCAARALLKIALQTLLDAGELEPTPLELLSRLVFAVLGEAGMYVAAAQDEAKAHAEARSMLTTMLRGLAPKTSGGS